jgi:hypothetical protein
MVESESDIIGGASSMVDIEALESGIAAVNAKSAPAALPDPNREGCILIRGSWNIHPDDVVKAKDHGSYVEVTTIQGTSFHLTHEEALQLVKAIVQE